MFRYIRETIALFRQVEAIRHELATDGLAEWLELTPQQRRGL